MTRYLALDVGGRRVGVAVSDLSGTLSTPHGVLRRGSKADDYSRIAKLLRELGIGVLVVGHPLGNDGERGPQARRIERYVAGLRDVLVQEGLDVEVEFWDESLSTRRAQDLMMASGRTAAYRRAREDAVAAAVILQDFLESGRAAGTGRDSGRGGLVW